MRRLCGPTLILLFALSVGACGDVEAPVETVTATVTGEPAGTAKPTKSGRGSPKPGKSPACISGGGDDVAPACPSVGPRVSPTGGLTGLPTYNEPPTPTTPPPSSEEPATSGEPLPSPLDSESELPVSLPTD